MGDGEKMQKKGQSFIKGALVLGVANLVVKIIGAVFKIPLINLIGDDGSGYFNVAYQIYTFMFIVATAGFPIAISKMVAESIARDNERDARRIFQTAISFLTVIGLVGSLILYFFADQLANLVGIADAALGIRAISPAGTSEYVPHRVFRDYRGRGKAFGPCPCGFVHAHGGKPGALGGGRLGKTAGGFSPYPDGLCFRRCHFWCDNRHISVFSAALGYLFLQ